jgi:hypothetical protein
MDPDRLQKVNLKRFENRLLEAWNALRAISYLSGAGRPAAREQVDLSGIVPKPVSHKGAVP